MMLEANIFKNPVIFLFVASNADKVFMNKNSNTYLWEPARLDECSKILFSNNTTVLKSLCQHTKTTAACMAYKHIYNEK